jgi:predicted RNA-binding Zn ribbon-like protein
MRRLEVKFSTPDDEQLMLDLLNSTPVIDGEQRDELEDPVVARRWLTAHGRQPASAEEAQAVLELRPLLQQVVRGTRSPADLAPFVARVAAAAGASPDGIEWSLELPGGRGAAACAVLAWDELRRSSPGRLRPCANPECRLFLIDRSKPNSARWCSMAVCGNRMKARRHYEKTRSEVRSEA